MELTGILARALIATGIAHAALVLRGVSVAAVAAALAARATTSVPLDLGCLRAPPHPLEGPSIPGYQERAGTFRPGAGEGRAWRRRQQVVTP